MPDAANNLIVVARELRRLGFADIVYVGGATVSLYLTDPATDIPRVTLDVDVIVDVGTRSGFYEVENRLRQAGHEPDPDGPVGRWRVRGIPVDLTPTTGAVLGFTNRWYRPLVDTARVVNIAPDLSIRVGTPGMFLAAKLEAFLDRGADDPVMSQDLTDIVSLVNGREPIVGEVQSLPSNVRAFVQRTVGDLLQDAQFAFVVHAHLPPDDASQNRAGFVLAQLRRIAKGGG